MRLGLRQRASWLAHVFKATTQQHHLGLRALLAAHIPTNGVIVDVGAHSGQFANLFAAMAARGRVYAFEPSAYARSIMSVALRLNRIGNVSVAPLGLSDAPGELVLHTPRKRWGSLGFGLAHLGEQSGGAGTFDQTVALTTLDAFAKDHGLERLDFVKVDVEGWELRALKGAERCLRRFGPALLLEVDDAYLGRAGDSAAGLFEWLAERGYCGFTIPSLSPASGYLGPGDYLFVVGQRTLT